MQKTLRELAEWLGGEIEGNADLVITGVTGIEEAGLGDITFAVGNNLTKAYRSDAGAVLIPITAPPTPKTVIRIENPRLAFTRLLELFAPPTEVERGVHHMAIIGDDVNLGLNTAIMAFAVIEDGATIGDNTIIYPHAYVGRDTEIGANCVIYPGVCVRERCRIGDRVIIHANAVIGSDGFGFVTIDGNHRKVPQVGQVIVENDVEIGACVTVDRATTAATVIKSGTKIDNLVHLAHNVVIGHNCFIVAQTGIAGNAKVGDNVVFAGQSGSVGHVTIGDNCVFAARSAPISDVPPGSFYAGFPARPHKDWLRSEVAAAKMPDLMKKVRELEKRLSELEKQL